MNAPPSGSTCKVLADDAHGITEAAGYIRDGQLVAFATETVYGLGGDATDDDAVVSIFKAKGRPRFNPLIVHYADISEISRDVDFNARAQKLAAAFWPGPLSLVLPRSANCRISLMASAGMDTLAVRIPDHKTARRLIVESQTPIAAPSANKSNHVSPTCAEHVISELGSDIAAVIDCGHCTVGIESTVLDLTVENPIVLRPGKVTIEEITSVLGTTNVMNTGGNSPNGHDIKSPGMLKRHYAPHQPLRMDAQKAEPHESLLGFGPEASHATLNLSPSGDLDEAAANLFAMIRDLDRRDFSGIAVMPVPETGLGCAINDRLRRAAHGSSA